MHTFNLIGLATASMAACVAATSGYDVTNFCDDTKWLTMSTNEQGVTKYNDILPSGTSRHYDIIGDHSLAVANSTDYWNSATYKLVLGTNSAGGVLYYAIGTANGYPLIGKNFVYSGPNCPSINTADGQTKGCADTGVNFRLTLCS